MLKSGSNEQALDLLISSSTEYNGEEEYKFARLIRRDQPFEQSSNGLRIRSSWGETSIGKMLKNDWFHLLLRYNTSYIVVCLVILWSMLIFFFAAVYYLADRIHVKEDCGLSGDGDEPISKFTAFAFSLETATTVGYGLPGDNSDSFFSACWELQFTIWWQMVFQMFFNSFLLAFFYSRISRSDTRANLVCFSDFATLNNNNLQIQICDLDRYKPLVESHVRIYCVNHKRLSMKKHRHLQPQMFSSRDALNDEIFELCRLTSPNDELGSQCFLSVPTRIHHTIDKFSPLNDNKVKGQIALREVDALTGSRDDTICGTCGETFPTAAALLSHIKYNAMIEECDENISGNDKYAGRRHYELDYTNPLSEPASSPPSAEAIRDKMRREGIEIIVLCESIDPLLSGTFLAMQSYTWKNIAVDKVHTNCLRVRTGKKQENKPWIDMSLFHSLTATFDDRVEDQVVDDGSSVEQADDGVAFSQTRKRRDSNLNRFFQAAFLN